MTGIKGVQMRKLGKSLVIVVFCAALFGCASSNWPYAWSKQNAANAAWDKQQAATAQAEQDAANAALAKQNAAIARYNVVQENANPLNLLLAAELARQVQNDIGSSTADRLKASSMLYDLAYKYARAAGFTRADARKFAGEFTDGSR